MKVAKDPNYCTILAKDTNKDLFRTLCFEFKTDNYIIKKDLANFLKEHQRLPLEDSSDPSLLRVYKNIDEQLEKMDTGSDRITEAEFLKFMRSYLLTDEERK